MILDLWKSTTPTVCNVQLAPEHFLTKVLYSVPEIFHRTLLENLINDAVA